MNMLNRALAFLASQGVSVPGMVRPSKHRTKSSRLSGIKGPKRKRLQMARGAGSINAKADILQLARQGKFLLAYDMAINHKRQCGEQLFPDYVLDAWMMEDIRPLTEKCP